MTLLFQLIALGFESPPSPLIQSLLNTLSVKYPFKILTFDEALKTPETLKLPLPSPESLPLMLYPHLQSDTPTYLLFGSNPLKFHSLFPLLKPFSRRAIIASTAPIKLPSTDFEFVDLAFLSTKPLRDLFALVFEKSEDLDSLRECDEMELYADSANEYALKLFTSWLFTRLHSKCKVHFHPQKSEALLSQIVLTSPSGNLFSFTEKNGTLHVEMTFKEKCELPLALPLTSFLEGPSLLEQLFYSPPSPHYAETLGAL